MGIIVVTSNCMTGGVIASFKSIFPEHEIKHAAVPQDKEQMLSLEKMITDSVVWFTSESFHVSANLNSSIIKLPNFYFDAFHPDLIYAKNRQTGALITPHYNSRIAVWCYANQIEHSDAAKLFNARTYASLGYYERWDVAVSNMRVHWYEAGYTEKEFLRFYFKVKREPVFMYSVNHPKLSAVIEYAKCAALKFDPGRDMRRRDIVALDGLTRMIWPVYPEIAAELGVRGNYFWRFDDVEFDEPRALIDFAYDCYRKLGVAPGDLVPFSPHPSIDWILRAQLTGS